MEPVTHLQTKITNYSFFFCCFSLGQTKIGFILQMFFSQIFNFKEQNSYNDHNGQDPIFQIPNHKIKQIKGLIFL